MTVQREKLEQTIVGVLEKHAPLVERTGRRRWDFALANGRPVAVTAQIDDEWVVMHAQLDAAVDAETRNSWEVLCLNARLDGGAKFVLPADTHLIGLRAEIPVDEDVDLQQRLHETCGAFKSALACFHAAHRSRPALQSSTPSGAGSDGFDLKALCEQTGWPLNQREDGSVAFDLQARTGFQQALVRSGPQERVSISADLAECPVLSVVSRRAISLMLLHASHLVRGVRAAGDVHDSSAVMRFETGFSSRPTARELEHALAALAVASDLCGRETVALQDEGTAAKYLSLQGWAGKSPAVTTESMIEAGDATGVAA